jgi:hypothetical protein
MADLSALRQNPDPDQEELEIRLLRNMTVQESFQQWLALQEAFEWQLQQTADLFAEERRQALIDLQARLAKLKLLQ